MRARLSLLSMAIVGLMLTIATLAGCGAGQNPEVTLRAPNVSVVVPTTSGTTTSATTTHATASSPGSSATASPTQTTSPSPTGCETCTPSPTGSGTWSPSPSPSPSPIPITAHVVTDNVATWATTDQASSLANGQYLSVRLERYENSQVVVLEVPIMYLGVYDDDPTIGNVLLCRTTDHTIVGAGDSGSPLLLTQPDGQQVVLGALAYGFDGSTHTFLVQPSAAMTAVLGNKMANKKTNLSRAAKSELPLGTPKKLAARYFKFSKANARVNRTLPSKLAKQFTVLAGDGGLPYGNGPSNPMPINGNSVGVVELSGTLGYAFSVGTLTMVGDSRLDAFGHELDSTGTSLPRDLPTVLAESRGIVADGYGNYYKDAVIDLTSPLGALTLDTTRGIQITRGQTAPTLPIDIRVQTSSNPNIPEKVYTHSLATDSQSFNNFLDFLPMPCFDDALGFYAGGSAQLMVTFKKGDHWYSVTSYTDLYGVTRPWLLGIAGEFAAPPGAVTLSNGYDMSYATTNFLDQAFDLARYDTLGDWQQVKISVTFDVTMSP